MSKLMFCFAKHIIREANIMPKVYHPSQTDIISNDILPDDNMI